MKAICLIISRLYNMHLMQIVKRFLELFKHYGIRAGRFEKALNGFIDLMQKNAIIPTFPVTANVVRKNALVFQSINKSEVDWAVHGLDHIDYTRISFKTAQSHYQKASEIFKKRQIPFTGYRFPFLRRNWSCIDELSQHGYQWDSSEAFYWRVIDEQILSRKQKKALSCIIDSYNPLFEDYALALPMMRHELVEIPVSLPDDDVLLARIHLKSAQDLFEIWNKIYLRVRERGEHFTLQVHPERFFKYRRALQPLIEKISKDPHSYVASISAIADWWIEKNQFRFEIDNLSKESFELKAACSERATILLKNAKDDSLKKFGYHNYSILNGRSWTFSGKNRPFIGVHPEFDRDICDFLLEEGYMLETNFENENYSIYLDDKYQFSLDNKVHILHTIEQTQNELIRFWRWPEGKRYAFTVSGDIDAVVLGDYFDRFKGALNG